LNNTEVNSLDLNSVLIIVGGTLVCGGALVLSQAPVVRAALADLHMGKLASEALGGFVRAIGDSIVSRS
jgi:hypothetical protein